jgi:glycosyltransferase involved in cell wall biosynthesis
MPTNPKVSVIIPTYNRANSIDQSIQSVLNQTYENIELIIIDDGSTDSTLKNLEKYERQLRVFIQENRGPASARNHGVSLSSGEIIAFLDSDDTWNPNKIESQVALLELCGQSVPCCICNSLMCSSRGQNTNSFDLTNIEPLFPTGIILNPTEVLATRFLLFNQAAIIRRGAFEAIGGFNENLRILEDYDIALRLSSQGPWAYIDEPLITKYETDHSLGIIARRNRTRELITIAMIINQFKLQRKFDSRLSNLLESEITKIKTLYITESLLISNAKITVILARIMRIGHIFLQRIHNKTFPNLISIHEWKKSLSEHDIHYNRTR